ncbi:diacylglycerol kinase family protein [Streptomyces sp. NBC_01808]|uniref:diacylglycerol kinase family protein n=1 Tax=Streptomyces sp. NBC_01808 TaxID=2975947 RepID=UPI002DDA6C29|nr:diacylglycerol kinase family protein [Streptomyces sp. NBC_01808]WSA39333.1 diacylglycerol kinase family protein [Streptomyces sp. NBC_01808]
MSAPDPTGRSLLVLIDPAARRADGEAVRIARDVLSAAAATKICLPETAPELARALARRGARRPVVIGDDRAFLRVVSELRRQETLADAPLALVPVGTARTLAATLGVPTGTVAAARTVLDGEERRLGLLVDDGGGVVLDALRLPAAGAGREAGRPEAARTPEGATAQAGTPATAPAATAPGGLAGLTQRMGSGASAVGRRWTPAAGLRALAARAVGQRNGTGREPGTPPVVTEWGAEDATGGWESGGAEGWPPTPEDTADATGGGPAETTPPDADFRLRVEADGVLLADLDGPSTQVRVVTDPTSGLAQVVIRPRGPGDPLHAEARSVRVWGSDFRYRADALLSPPVSQRTWTAHPNAWRLITAPMP